MESVIDEYCLYALPDTGIRNEVEETWVQKQTDNNSTFTKRSSKH